MGTTISFSCCHSHPDLRVAMERSTMEKTVIGASPVGVNTSDGLLSTFIGFWIRKNIKSHTLRVSLLPW